MAPTPSPNDFERQLARLEVAVGTLQERIERLETSQEEAALVLFGSTRTGHAGLVALVRLNTDSIRTLERQRDTIKWMLIGSIGAQGLSLTTVATLLLKALAGG